jgi:4a-hydroxytetrahydrobiopterin dehydratase
MARDPKLSKADVRAAVRALPAFAVKGGRLRCELRFRDFDEAWAFMGRVARAAKRLDHHPDWSNSWNRVTIDLTTHDAGGLTRRDVELATKIQALLAAR